MGMGWLAEEGSFIHQAPEPGEFFTPCCNLGLSELPHGDRVSDVSDEVTCPVHWVGRPPARIITSIGGKFEGSQERLSRVRARIVRASSSEINSGLRDELLRLIDRGEW